MCSLSRGNCTCTPTNLKQGELLNGELSFIFYSIDIEYGANHEKTEKLEEYVTSKSSPWHLDYSWSKEAKNLRELAVKSPWLIDDNFILNFFKTLRICDKDVSGYLMKITIQVIQILNKICTSDLLFYGSDVQFP
jgi:hypothetical protein